MAEKMISLSARATDVLYALFFRGALHSGNLPSKSGAAELRELGFAESRHTAMEYLKTNHFTFLTAQGQEFAIENLVKTRFGVPVGGYLGEASGKLYSAGIGISIEGDQRKAVFETFHFKAHETSISFSNNEELALNGGLAFVGPPGAISHDKADRADGNNATKTILSDEMREAIISAVRESDLFTSRQSAIAAQEASNSDLKQALNDAVGDAIRNAIKPGGALWVAISHR